MVFVHCCSQWCCQYCCQWCCHYFFNVVVVLVVVVIAVAVSAAVDAAAIAVAGVLAASIQPDLIYFAAGVLCGEAALDWGHCREGRAQCLHLPEKTLCLFLLIFCSSVSWLWRW